MITRKDIDDYVETLDSSLRRIYYDNDEIRLSCEDTLSDEFQIVAEIDEIFKKYAERLRLGDYR